MEPNAGGMYSKVQQQSAGMLGLEMSLQHNIPPPPPPQTSQQQQQAHMPPHHHPMAVGFGPLDGGDYRPHHTQQQQPIKPQPYPVAAKSKIQSLTLSDDDDNSGDDGKKKMMSSPWHRMKWTDNMVRLLIMVVFYIGDEAGSEGNNNNNDPKKKATAGGGAVLQKKGKWKSVSRAMMERGFYVSPQQCEDKFNDLNKRYKRVNDILGKGTACRVVENQSLLEGMDHITPKMKDEVKKLLNSKHLFFREMCAYHNSCGHGGPSGAAHHSPPDVVPVPETSNRPNVNNKQPPQQQQSCLHSTADANKLAAKAAVVSSEEDGDEEEDDDDEDEDDEVVGGGGSGVIIHQDEFNSTDGRGRKRVKRGVSSPVVEQLDGELASVMQDESKSLVEKRRWMKMKMMQLEESKVGILTQAFEIEKQRLKWLKFSSKKEREMEKEKLTNERLKLENERMVLLLKQKEMDCMDHHQQGNVIR